MELIPSSEMKSHWAVFSGAVETFFGQRWLSHYWEIVLYTCAWNISKMKIQTS